MEEGKQKEMAKEAQETKAKIEKKQAKQKGDGKKEEGANLQQKGGE